MTYDESDNEAFGVRMHRVEVRLDGFNHRLLAVEQRLASTGLAAAPASRFPRQPQAPIDTTAPPEAAAPYIWSVPVEDATSGGDGVAIQNHPVPLGNLQGSGRQRRTAYVRSDSSAPAEVDWEKLVSGRGLAWVGGLALLLGTVYFLSLAFNRGWISPGVRVILGVVAGLVLTSGGALFFKRREVLFGHVLTAVGLGVVSLSMVAATRLFDLIPVELGLLGSLASAGLAAAIAVRFNSQIVAAFGVVSVLFAPPSWERLRTGPRSPSSAWG